MEELRRERFRCGANDVRRQLSAASASPAPPFDVVPSDRAVERISAGRRGTEPSLVSVAVRIGDDFRQDGTMYVPGPGLGYHPYLINHPEYFAQNGDNNARKGVTASMLWSSAGAYYDRAPEFSMLCLD